jgi:hypothetical protein
MPAQDDQFPPSIMDIRMSVVLGYDFNDIAQAAQAGICP